MSTPQFTKKHLKMMQENKTITDLQAYLLTCVMEWIQERVSKSEPLTPREKEMGDTALTLVDHIKQLVIDAEKSVN